MEILQLVNRPVRWYLELPSQRKLLFIIIVSILIQGSLIAIDNWAFQSIDGYQRSPDIPIFRHRAETILKGGLLYRDVHTETPPVVNYVMTIPVLFGGSYLAFQIFFSMCNIAVSMLLFYTFNNRTEKGASLLALFYVIHPFSWFHSTLDCQDEPLILLLFIIPIYLLLKSKYLESATAAGIGIWAKMWPLLLCPLYLIKGKKWMSRFTAILHILFLSIIIIGPFLLLAPEESTWFLRFYFLGVEGEGSGGISLWHFLDQRGMMPPSMLLGSTVMVLVLGLYLWADKEDWGVWKTITVVMTVFFVLYPKIHSGYYLIPLVLLMPYMLKDARYAILSFLMFTTVFTAFKFSDGTIHPDGVLILVPICCALITNMLLLLALKDLVIGTVEPFTPME